MPQPSVSLIKKLPKADLHSHIDGSVPPRDLFAIAKRNGRRLLTSRGVELDSPDSLLRHIEGSGYGSLLKYIVDRFYPITGLMQTAEVIREVGLAYVGALASDGIRYAEGRFAPQYHTREGMTYAEVIESMSEGLREGAEHYNVRVKPIVAVCREVDARAGLEVARVAVGSKSVVGLDLAGAEEGNPPERFVSAFKIASEHGLGITVHAGEEVGPLRQNLRNIWTAITRLGAQRVGHAIHLSKDDSLVSLVLRRSVTVEMNPVSNLVLGRISNIRNLNVDSLLASKVRVTVNSDDPALWPHGALSEVLGATCDAYGLGQGGLDRLLTNSFRGAFATDAEKNTLIEEYFTARRRLS